MVLKHLLHDFVLSRHCSVFQILSVCSGTDEFPINNALLLSASLAQLAMSVDLVVEVHLYEVLLLLSCIQILLNLHKGLFWAKVWLIVEYFYSFLSLLFRLFLLDLVAEKFTISRVLVLSIHSLHVLNTVRVVHS